MRIAVDDRTVSRRHAVLRQLPGSQTYTASDAESANGTWLNGKRLSQKPVELPSGDQLLLGRGQIVLPYLPNDATVSPEGVTLAGPLDPYQLGARWQRPLQAAPWIRLAGAILGAIAAALAIMTR